MQFDARAAKQLVPGEVMKFADCPGLRLEVTASRASWTYRYKSLADGRMRQIGIGHWPAMTHLAAAAEWERLRAVRDAGRDPAKEKRAAVAETRKEETGGMHRTVKAVIQAYLAGHVDQVRKARGAKEMRRMLESMTVTIEDMDPQKVTRSVAFDLLERFKGIPVVAATLRGELGAAWDYALDAGRLPDTCPNWWRQIMRGKLRSKGKKIAAQNIGVSKRSLGEQEIGKVLLWLPNFSALIEDALLLYFWTMCRGSEIVSMEGSEITEEADGLWWTIPKAKTKNARHALATDLRVPLVGRAETVVRRRLGLFGKGWLFPKQGKPHEHTTQVVIGSQVFQRQPYSKARESRGLPALPVTHWTPHDLRRTGRTLLPSLGCPEEIAEALLGHMPEGVKGVYNRYQYDRERRHWLTVLSNKLEELAAAS